MVVNSIAVVTLAPWLLGVKWYLALVSILVGPVIGYGVVLGGALTNIALVSAIGKFVIICMGHLSGDVVQALWLAGIGMVMIGSASDLIGDYKVGFLAGATSRNMLKAQVGAVFLRVRLYRLPPVLSPIFSSHSYLSLFALSLLTLLNVALLQVIGALVASVFTPLTYRLFLDGFDITSAGKFTAPGAVALRAMATLFVDGFEWALRDSCDVVRVAYQRVVN
jgi:hypothetical protein